MTIGTIHSSGKLIPFLISEITQHSSPCGFATIEVRGEFIPKLKPKQKRMSKTQKILGHLREGKSITPLAALKQYGSFRLAAEIHRIREWGWNVVTQPVRRGKSIVASYRLEAE